MKTFHLGLIFQILSRSAYFLTMALWICFHLLQEETPLMVEEQGSDLRVQQGVLRGYCIVPFLQQKNNIWFSPRFLGYLVSGQSPEQYQGWVPSPVVGLKCSQIVFCYQTRNRQDTSKKKKEAIYSKPTSIQMKRKIKAFPLNMGPDKIPLSLHLFNI